MMNNDRWKDFVSGIELYMTASGRKPQRGWIG